MNIEELTKLIEEAEELNNKGNSVEAESLINKLLDEKILDQDLLLKSKALLILSHTLWQQGKVKESLSIAEQSLKYSITSNTDNSILANKAEAKALNTIGVLYDYLSNYPKTKEYYCRALVLYEDIRNKSRIALVAMNIGNVHLNLSEIPKALEYYNRSLSLYEEIGNKLGVADATSGIGVVYFNLTEFSKAHEFFNSSLTLYKEIGNKLGVANVTCFIGNVYYNFSDFTKALEYYRLALNLQEEIGNKRGLANVIGSIGNIYSDLSDHSKAIEYQNRALSLHEEIGDVTGVARVTMNIGFIYSELSDFHKALEYYIRALSMQEEIGNKNLIAADIGHIGNIYYNLSNYSKALEYYERALALHEEFGDKKFVAVVTCYIGELYTNQSFENYNPVKAEEYLLKAAKLNSKIGTKDALYNNYKSISQLYETLFRWEEALNYFKLFHELEKEVLSEETKKKAELFDIQRKQADIDKQLAVERAKHEATETLLHNVLPISIANRIINGENLIAEKLSNVSVLFADIVNFTKLSQSISPEQLVDGLDRIFTAFDLLADKYNLEKIKTIGDAYMVVAGAPLPRNDHAQAMANMAIDMIEAMKQFTSITTGEPIQIRIGIHSGEVVAGVIGKKKFAYDLWGDAVNTASRMESHGEPNQIHISQDFYNELISSNLFSIDNFIDRGKMEIKGKGVLKTYFLIKS